MVILLPNNAATSVVLARLKNVPTRVVPALLTFGGMLGAPALVGLVGASFFALGWEAAGVACCLLAFLLFAGFVVAAWVLIFSGRTRLRRAEQALYAGDFESATRDARFVVRTVFRSDYQLGALFTLALAAERLGAFAEAGALFGRALDMVPAMAAARPGRRARALLAAHASLDWAAAGDVTRAAALLARCYDALGAAGQPGALDMLLDDSYMGAVGINSILVELENRREPRPLAVLASLLVNFRRGQFGPLTQALNLERSAIDRGLAPHERALADRIGREVMRQMAGAGPHRSPDALVAGSQDATASWAALIIP